MSCNHTAIFYIFVTLLASFELLRPQKNTSVYSRQIKHTELKHKSHTVRLECESSHQHFKNHNCIYYFGHCDKLQNRENINELLIRTIKKTAQKNNVCNWEINHSEAHFDAFFVCKLASEGLLQGNHDKPFLFCPIF